MSIVGLNTFGFEFPKVLTLMPSSTCLQLALEIGANFLKLLLKDEAPIQIVCYYTESKGVAWKLYC
jgi:hypothetical protein